MPAGCPRSQKSQKTAAVLPAAVLAVCQRRCLQAVLAVKRLLLCCLPQSLLSKAAALLLSCRDAVRTADSKAAVLLLSCSRDAVRTADCPPHMTYSIILPLSLVCRLVGKLSHSRPRTKLKELDPPKGLGEQIRKLILGVDVSRLDASFCQTVTDEMIPHPDVLAPFMEHGVLGQRQGLSLIHI